MNNWVLQLQKLLKIEKQLVVVSVASVKGSTPRDPGARMLVSATDVIGTIGGGHLEYKAIQLAQNMLKLDVSNELQHFSLGAGLGQCCGGVVTLFFEVVTDQSVWPGDLINLMAQEKDCVQVIPVSSLSNGCRMLVTQDSVIHQAAETVENTLLITMAREMLDNLKPATIAKCDKKDYVFDPVVKQNFNIVLLGAGHVGQALVKLLVDQPCEVNWVDSREDQLPEQVADNVVTHCTDTPEAVIDDAPAGSYFLVMTHDHNLDQMLAEQILKRDDFVYFGLIGSATKRKRFEHRLLRRGISADKLMKMTCPVGISGLNSKRPSSIALAVTAELLLCYEQKCRRLNNKLNDQVLPEQML